MIPRTFLSTLALASLAVAACHPPMPVPAPSAQADGVIVSKAPPPADARPLGRLVAEHGSGCGMSGQKGSYEGAEAIVRNRTAAMGGDYAEIVRVEPPIHTMDCLANAWVLHAVAYRVSPSPSPASPPASAPDCAPPCSPGYACSAGVCVALCNPTCGAGQVCRQDRVCVTAP